MKICGAKSHRQCPCSITSGSYFLSLLQKIKKKEGVDIEFMLKAEIVHSVASCVVDEFDPGGALDTFLTEHAGVCGAARSKVCLCVCP